MSWLSDWFKYKVCLTRVLHRDGKHIAQVRYAFVWMTLLERNTELQETYFREEVYDEEQRMIQVVRDVAAAYARTHRGYYIGTIEYESLSDKIKKWFRANLTGPQGLPGVPGCQGPMGMVGPAYDDLECPHCETRRSYIFPRVKLHFDCYGEDAPLVYTCKNVKCGKQSNWIAYNGIFLNASTITKHDPRDNEGNETAELAVP